MGWVLEAVMEVEFYQKYRKLVEKESRDFIVFSIVTLDEVLLPFTSVATIVLWLKVKLS